VREARPAGHDTARPRRHRQHRVDPRVAHDRELFPYAAAKSGLVGLSRSLALDYAPKGIRVNAVSPGWTRTHLVDEWFARQPDPAAAESSILSAHPLKRMATSEEVANVVAFVASDEASAMTGAEILVDCGLGVQFAK
jgi:NAD(P)-dependent dehydrogenase (short-subunit alcohol dehydrogenase family)